MIGADMNGWQDMPEAESERLDICNRLAGYRLLASYDRLEHSRETLRTSRLRMNRRAA